MRHQTLFRARHRDVAASVSSESVAMDLLSAARSLWEDGQTRGGGPGPSGSSWPSSQTSPPGESRQRVPTTSPAGLISMASYGCGSSTPPSVPDSACRPSAHTCVDSGATWCVKGTRWCPHMHSGKQHHRERVAFNVVHVGGQLHCVRPTRRATHCQSATTINRRRTWLESESWPWLARLTAISTVPATHTTQQSLDQQAVHTRRAQRVRGRSQNQKAPSERVWSCRESTLETARPGLTLTHTLTHTLAHTLAHTRARLQFVRRSSLIVRCASVVVPATPFNTTPGVTSTACRFAAQRKRMRRASGRRPRMHRSFVQMRNSNRT